MAQREASIPAQLRGGQALLSAGSPWGLAGLSLLTPHPPHRTAQPFFAKKHKSDNGRPVSSRGAGQERLNVLWVKIADDRRFEDIQLRVNGKLSYYEWERALILSLIMVSNPPPRECWDISWEPDKCSITCKQGHRYGEVFHKSRIFLLTGYLKPNVRTVQ